MDTDLPPSLGSTLARALLTHSDLGVIGLDETGRVLVWNTWIAGRTGVSADAARQRTLPDIFPDLSSSFQRHLEAVLQSGQPRVLSPVLHPAWLSSESAARQVVRLLPLHDPDGSSNGTLILIWDMTAQLAYEEAAEAELRRTIRALRVLSECNQALIRAVDEARLLDDVCQIIVSEGGFRLAWVGFARQDEARTVRPVAQAGDEDGYLDTVRITWADDEWGRGPTGRAIRSGEPVVARHILTDPDYAPWRADAARRGYASSIALPLLLPLSSPQPGGGGGGGALGALNIYASEPDAFDEQEVKLLRELADDLAYGLDTLRTRAARERAEEALRESEARFRSVVEQSTDGITLTDEQGAVIAWNRSMEAITGLHAAEMVGQPIWDVQFRLSPPAQQTPEALDGLRQSLQRFLKTGESPWAGQRLEREYHHPDGSRRYLQGTVFSTRTAKGFILASLSRDVTAQKQAELALQEQLQRMEQLLNTTLDGYILADTEGQVVDVNPAYCRLTGYSRDELLQMNIEQLEGQLSPEEIEQRIELMVRQGGARFETRHRRKDGQLLDLETSITIVQPGTRPLVAAFVRDITERKQAEGEIRQRARELAALNAVGQQVSASLSVEQVAQAALAAIAAPLQPDLALFFQRQGDSLILKAVGPPGASYHHAETPVHRVGECLCGLAVREGRPLYSSDIHCDARCTWDECKRAGLCSFAALPLHGGDEVIGVLGLASAAERDFSQQAEFLETLTSQIAIALQNALLHEEIQRHAAELEQRVADRTVELEIARDRALDADRLKSAFLAAMSHELRTPLNSIIGFTGILLQGLAGPLNDEQHKQLGMVRNSAHHLLALINDVLDLSKIEAGQLEIAAEPFDLPVSICRVLDTMRPLAEKKGLALAAEIAPQVGRFIGDRRRVEQILLNLLSNAVKFTDQGQVRLVCRVDDGHLRAEVHDTGVGLRAEDMDRLFEPFQQAEPGLARPHEGTGLGLSICKRLVEMMGGEIWVESEWGVGSTFAFTLPIKPVIASERSERSNDQSPVIASERSERSNPR